MRSWVLATSLLVLLVPAATAHGDSPSWSGTWVLEPGASTEAVRAVHWHRVVGTLEADEDIVLLVEGQVVAGPDRRLDVDHLVRCCDAMWTDRTFAIENRGSAPVEVQADLAFLHDNFAVVADDAEPGAWWQTLVIIGALIAIPAWRARQSPIDDGRAWLRTSRVLHGAAWGLGAVLALVGMARAGTGPLVGTLAATAPFPSDVGGFFNTHSLVMLALMALWGAAYATWAGARRRTEAGLWQDGAVFAAGPLVIGAMFLAEFGGGWIAVVLAVIPAAAVVADLRFRPPQELGEDGRGAGA